MLEEQNNNEVIAPQKVKENLLENCYKLPSVDERIYRKIGFFLHLYLIESIENKITENPDAIISYFGRTFEKPEFETESIRDLVYYYTDNIAIYLTNLANIVIENSIQAKTPIQPTTDNSEINCIDNFDDLAQKFDSVNNFRDAHEEIYYSSKLKIKSNPERNVLVIYASYGKAKLKDVFEVALNGNITFTGVNAMKMIRFTLKGEDYTYLSELLTTKFDNISPFFDFSDCFFHVQGIELFDRERVALSCPSLVFHNCKLNKFLEMLFVFPNYIPEIRDTKNGIDSRKEITDNEALINIQ